LDMAIETFNLTKKYGAKIGCAKVSLRVPWGQIFTCGKYWWACGRPAKPYS